MTILVLGLLLFLGVHSVRMAAPQLREAVVARHGQRAWILSFAIASIAGVVLIVWGYGMARQNPVVLYTPPPRLHHLALLVMLPVFPLFAASHAPGRIKAAVGHPMLMGTLLWGLAHLMTNGTMADLLLFGGFAVWAVADWVSSVRYPRKPADVRVPALRADIIAVVAGLVIYAALVGGLHRLLFGVSP